MPGGAELSPAKCCTFSNLFTCEQWYINFPSAIAQAMEFSKGETVEWLISDKAHLILSRSAAPPAPVKIQKKTLPWV